MRGHGWVPGKVSVVIVVFNRVDLTQACVNSILASDDVGLVHELVFVDNHSTDETPEYLRAFHAANPQNVQIATLTENVGYSRGANVGAGLAEGEFVFLLNNDTEVRDGWLRTQLEQMEPDVGAVAGTLIDPDGTIQHTGVEFRRDGTELVAYNTTTDRPASDMDCIAGTASLMRAYAYWQGGGHDPTFRNGYEDVDLCLRFRDRGWRLRYTPDSVVMHHKHASGPERWANVQDNIARLQELWG